MGVDALNADTNGETRGDGTVGVNALNADTNGDDDAVANGDGDEDLLIVTGVKSPSLLEL